MLNGHGASEAVSSTCPHEILMKNDWDMALLPPGQFASHVLIKIFLEIVGNRLWGLLDSFLYISLLTPS